VHILLVEDDPLNVELFVDILEDDGHTVAVEQTGLDGRAHALREVFDLIILDIQLPGMRGDDRCRELRGIGVRTPIIALSAAALSHQVEAGLEAGFDQYLTKPIRPATLREATRALGWHPEA
jgi:DNA-binding response OmpR family regulator